MGALPTARDELDPLRRILMLVPHEPRDDPRIDWVTQLCAEIARTDVIGAVNTDLRPVVEYDGRVALERANVFEVGSTSKRLAAALLAAPAGFGSVRRYVQRLSAGEHADRSHLAQLDHSLGALRRFLSGRSYTRLIASALERKARSLSIPPRAILCHDVYALLAAPALKRRFRCPVIYDSHEFWPQADLLSQAWEQRLMTRLERAAIQHADVVITVSPPLAEHMRELYGLRRVVAVPNAEPFDASVTPSRDRPSGEPVRFLLQGQAAPGRGIETLLGMWATLGRADVLLELRCPENPYLAELRERFEGLTRDGVVAFLPPVRENELVSAAAASDVGVIPYVGPNLNHVFACPNKLSQYMHAGLAILANDLVFVGEVVRRYDCGVVYQAGEPDSLARAIHQLVDDRERLNALKRNAYDAVRREFNWRVQSQPYREVLADAVGVRLAA